MKKAPINWVCLLRIKHWCTVIFKFFWGRYLGLWENLGGGPLFWCFMIQIFEVFWGGTIFHLKEVVLVFETSPSLFPQFRWEGNLAHGHQSELVDLDQYEELLQVSGEDVGLEEEEEQDEEDDFHEERVDLPHHRDRVLAVSGLHNVLLLFFVFKNKNKFFTCKR